MGWGLGRCLNVNNFSCQVIQGMLHFPWGLLSCCLTLWLFLCVKRFFSSPVIWGMIFPGGWAAWNLKLATLPLFSPYLFLSAIRAFNILGQHGNLLPLVRIASLLCSNQITVKSEPCNSIKVYFSLYVCIHPVWLVGAPYSQLESQIEELVCALPENTPMLGLHFTEGNWRILHGPFITSAQKWHASLPLTFHGLTLVV